MVSVADGRVSTYGLGELQGRGVFFVSPGMDVYAGMVVGEHSRDDDLEVRAPGRAHGRAEAGMLRNLHACTLRAVHTPCTRCVGFGAWARRSLVEFCSGACLVDWGKRMDVGLHACMQWPFVALAGCFPTLE